MIREIKVTMPYEKDLSVNHYLGRRKGGGYYVKPEVKTWKEEVGWKIVTAHIEDWKRPIHIRCDGWFKDKRSTPDLSNLSKIICDAIEDTCGVNDQVYRWEDGNINYTTDPPFLVITIRENGSV